jgi:putative aldouronate transport system permease protein
MKVKIKLLKQLPYIAFLLPGMIAVFIYSYIPMAGIAIAFQKFIPAKGLFGSEWIGLDNLLFSINLPDFWQVIWNTLYISSMKIVAGLFFAILVSLLLNEISKRKFKRTLQTVIYLPHFLSWVILGGILIDILSPSTGIINSFIKLLGLKPIFFLGDNRWFPTTLVITNIWKEFGFNTIIYMAALTAINPNLYEAALIDGANRWQQTIHVTLPGILPTIILLATLSLGNILSAGFDQIFNLYSPVVYESGDILDTLIFRVGLQNNQYGVAAALGLVKSFVSLILISVSYWLAYRFANYRIF